MSDKSKPIIKYTNREFESIKNELIEYAKHYYPNTFKDLSVNSFNSLILDMVALIGDQLSFNLDYCVNESFEDSANEFRNILRMGRMNGFKNSINKTTSGIATFYITVPAAASGAPNETYVPILKAGSEFGAQNGSQFTLITDVNFSDPANARIVSKTNSQTGGPSEFAIRAFGIVISGETRQETFNVGSFKKFLRLELKNPNITEILSCVDANGKEYYEVDYLSQDVIYKPGTNFATTTNDQAINTMRAFPVPRRFVTEYEENKTVLQFGHGSPTNLDETTPVDPANVVLNMNGKAYIADRSFDPSKLIASDKFGIAPSNTTLRVTYRSNSKAAANIGAKTLNKVSNAIFQFGSEVGLNVGTMSQIKSSLEVSNEDPFVGDISIQTAEELRIRILDSFATQNRCVTKRDYQSCVYNMPSSFGAVKKCSVVQDSTLYKRKLNVYVISETSEGYLIASNAILKNNIKTHLNEYRMINDSIDIYDATILNFGINFECIGKPGVNKTSLFSRIYAKLIEEKFNRKLDIGEGFPIYEIYSIINRVDDVIDTTKVQIVLKSGGLYSAANIKLKDWVSPDGRFLNIPCSYILELKYPKLDIKGSIQ